VGAFRVKNEDYHNAPGISKSGLDQVDDCPAYFRYCKENPEEPTDDLEFGSAVHTAVLEPELLNERVVIAPEHIQRRGTKEWNQLVEQSVGKIVLKFDQGAKLLAMQKAVLEHSRAYLLRGVREVAFWWKDPETGLLCKCKPDVWNVDEQTVVDYKTAIAIYPAIVFGSAMLRCRYHVQGAFYTDGVGYALEQSGQGQVPKPDPFMLFAQQKHAPHYAKPWIVGSASIALGRRAYQANLAVIKECEDTGRWPAYPEKAETLECPEKAWDRELDQVEEMPEVIGG
jgi:exodeoxyribonuclease VIII